MSKETPKPPRGGIAPQPGPDDLLLTEISPQRFDQPATPAPAPAPTPAPATAPGQLATPAPTAPGQPAAYGTRMGHSSARAVLPPTPTPRRQATPGAQQTTFGTGPAPGHQSSATVHGTGPAPASPATSHGTGPAPQPGSGAPVSAASPFTGQQPQQALELKAGTRIEHYELIRELGRGGMGQVFLARDIKLGRRVAMKFLLGAGRDFTERFLVEARATAQCNHENIVIIHEVNEYYGLPYMVLEFLEGETLSGVMSTGAIPAARAVELIIPVVRALARAHEFNIVHRDLKPDNIFVTDTGIIKVLDFGIAKLFSKEDDHQPRQPNPAAVADIADSQLTQEGALVGTLPYMSPEQFGVDKVDFRTDIWAVGIILHEMVAGRHPLSPLTPQVIMTNAVLVDQPMPPVLEAAPHLNEHLARVIDSCLAKRKDHRYASASQLLQALEPLMPGRFGRQLREGESPYPGLTAFQEGDADRFFGRSRDIVRMVTRIREQPLVGVAGPSGVGKSSFVRAGLVPALKSSGENWETFIVRPGRSPMAALASLLQPLTTSTSGDLATKMSEHQALLQKLWNEPGYLGTLLRSRARQKDSQVLLFVDQFEELYTLVGNENERRAFTACLSGVADDAAAPLRVVVSMRSDFLDRVAEDQRFLDELTRGLVFLQPPDRRGLREALTQPIEMVGYRFESPDMVEHMLDALESTPGALPLLQFAAARLWDARDRTHRLLTQERYEAMGGIAGTLASHADEVLASLAAPAQQLVRLVFQRLVTPDGTRAIVDVAELLQMSPDREELERVVNHLVQARLLLVQTRSDSEGPAVEVVHESLISSWPTMRRWLDEGHEDAAFLSQLRTAAKQWEDSGRGQGLLWRGETMEDARRWYRRRHKDDLPPRDHDYIKAVLALADRSRRIKRGLLAGSFIFLIALVAAAAIALVTIRDAEKQAKVQAVVAETEARKARAAESKIADQLEELQAKERARLAAESKAEVAETKAVKAETEVAESKEDLKKANKNLVGALEKAERAQAKAEKAQATAETLAAKERKSREQLKVLLDKETARANALEKERKKLSTELKLR